MSAYSEDIHKQIQQRAVENVCVNGSLSIGSITQIVNQILQPDNQKNSFCGLVKWISEKSDSIQALSPCYNQEILEIFRKNFHQKEQQIYDFTIFEIKVFDLVFNFCHYYLNNGKARSKEFAKFKKQEDYYSYMNELIKSGEKIRVGSVKLSSLITDHKMSALVEKVEGTNDTQ